MTWSFVILKIFSYNRLRAEASKAKHDFQIITESTDVLLKEERIVSWLCTQTQCRKKILDCFSFFCCCCCFFLLILHKKEKWFCKKRLVVEGEKGTQKSLSYVIHQFGRQTDKTIDLVLFVVLRMNNKRHVHANYEDFILCTERTNTATLRFIIFQLRSS